VPGRSDLAGRPRGPPLLERQPGLGLCRTRRERRNPPRRTIAAPGRTNRSGRIHPCGSAQVHAGVHSQHAQRHPNWRRDLRRVGRGTRFLGVVKLYLDPVSSDSASKPTMRNTTRLSAGLNESRKRQAGRSCHRRSQGPNASLCRFDRTTSHLWLISRTSSGTADS